MQRFENAKIGDKVYCRICGNGEVNEVNNNSTYPIYAEFEDGTNDTYAYCGKLFLENSEATLFYRDDTSNYLEERPAPKLDWSKVPVDTKITVNSSSAKLDTRCYRIEVSDELC